MNETFKPFQQVLVKQNACGEWKSDFYSHYRDKAKLHSCIGGVFGWCIPYEGNEHLLGTTDPPHPKRWRAERDGNYWFVDCDGTPTEIYESFDYFDDKRYEVGNYFRTREEAEKVADKFKASLKGE